MQQKNEITKMKAIVLIPVYYKNEFVISNTEEEDFQENQDNYVYIANGNELLLLNYELPVLEISLGADSVKEQVTLFLNNYLESTYDEKKLLLTVKDISIREVLFDEQNNTIWNIVNTKQLDINLLMKKINFENINDEIEIEHDFLILHDKLKEKYENNFYYNEVKKFLNEINLSSYNVKSCDLKPFEKQSVLELFKHMNLLSEDFDTKISYKSIFDENHLSIKKINEYLRKF